MDHNRNLRVITGFSWVLYVSGPVIEAAANSCRLSLPSGAVTNSRRNPPLNGSSRRDEAVSSWTGSRRDPFADVASSR